MIKVLHLEPTDVCQAACPLCARELDPAFNKSLKHHLTVEQVQQHLSDAAIGNLDKMFMCGNYGDPAAGLYTLELYDYFRKINPTITLGMNTNGGIRGQWWWNQIGLRFNQPRDYVVFSIDGLEDTNHIYRKNVNWNSVMFNAQAFIDAGGSAHWDMLVYKHNEHQVDACEQLARDMGFKWFRAKVSKREYINGLEEPSGWGRHGRVCRARLLGLSPPLAQRARLAPADGPHLAPPRLQQRLRHRLPRQQRAGGLRLPPGKRFPRREKPGAKEKPSLAW